MATRALKTVENIIDELDTPKGAHRKLMAARRRFHSLELKKTGKNTFAGYSYFELGDFLIPALQVFGEVGLCATISFTNDLATMTITDLDNIEDRIVLTSPMGSAALKGCHEVQNIGAVETYQRRYLWVAALEIVEHDALDATTGRDAVKDNPATGERGPRSGAQKTHLDGPYDTVPKLEKAAKEFVRTLNGMSTLAEFDEFRDDKEVQAFVAQIKRDLPGWWFANHKDNPPDFIPLEVLAANTRRGLAALETEKA